MTAFFPRSLVLAACLLLSISGFAQGSTERVWGDVNRDGTVNSSDALSVNMYVAGVPHSQHDFSLADVNADSAISSADALIILYFAVGFDVGTSRVGSPAAGSTPSAALDFVETFEDGGFSRWGYQGRNDLCCPHSASAVRAPVRSGSLAARFELRPGDPVVGNSKRSELFKWDDDTGGVGDEKWYGLSIYIPADWVQLGGGDYQILAQWHSRPDFDLGETWAPPPLAIWIDKAEWSIWSYWDPKPVTVNGAPEPEGGRAALWKGAFQKGVWTDWVVHAKWSYRSDGLLEIWKNGVLVVRKQGPNTYNDQGLLYFKIGIYKWPWYPNAPSSAVPRVVYHDEIRIGNAGASYADVAPR